MKSRFELAPIGRHTVSPARFAQLCTGLSGPDDRGLRGVIMRPDEPDGAALQVWPMVARTRSTCPFATMGMRLVVSMVTATSGTPRNAAIRRAISGSNPTNCPGIVTVPRSPGSNCATPREAVRAEHAHQHVGRLCAVGGCGRLGAVENARRGGERGVGRWHDVGQRRALAAQCGQVAQCCQANQGRQPKWLGPPEGGPKGNPKGRKQRRQP